MFGTTAQHQQPHSNKQVRFAHDEAAARAAAAQQAEEEGHCIKTAFAAVVDAAAVDSFEDHLSQLDQDHQNNGNNNIKNHHDDEGASSTSGCGATLSTADDDEEYYFDLENNNRQQGRQKQQRPRLSLPSSKKMKNNAKNSSNDPDQVVIMTAGGKNGDERVRCVRFCLPSDGNERITNYYNEKHPVLWTSPKQRPFWSKRAFWAIATVVLFVLAGIAAIVPVALYVPRGGGNDESSSDNNNGDTETGAGGGSPSDGFSGGGPLPGQPVVSEPLCIESNEELVDAVDAYLEFRYNASSNQNNTIGTVLATYGEPINSWCLTSNVTDMSSLFSGARNPLAAFFNEPIDRWNVSSVMSMQKVFLTATSFNQSLEGWDTSNLLDASFAFKGATSYDQPMATWQVSKVQNFRQTFFDATAFDQDVSGWDVSSAQDMRGMFRYAESFNQNLCGWGVQLLRGQEDGGISSLPDVTNMFQGTKCPRGTDPSLPSSSQNLPGPFCAVCSSNDGE